MLSDFDRVRAYWPLHAQSNMPGKLMLSIAQTDFGSALDVLPWLVVFVSNLGGVLMYVFVRDLFADRRAALYSLVLYLFVPGKLLTFFPLLNTATPAAALRAPAFCSDGSEQERRTRAALARPYASCL